MLIHTWQAHQIAEVVCRSFDAMMAGWARWIAAASIFPTAHFRLGGILGAISEQLKDQPRFGICAHICATFHHWNFIFNLQSSGREADPSEWAVKIRLSQCCRVALKFSPFRFDLKAASGRCHVCRAPAPRPSLAVKDDINLALFFRWLGKKILSSPCHMMYSQSESLFFTQLISAEVRRERGG